MLSEDGRKKEIERRKGGGSLALPSPKEDEVIGGFFTTPHRMYLVSQYGIYQAFTSDDVDPDVKEANVPWVINRYLGFGTRSKLFAFIVGMERNISGNVIIEQNKQVQFREKLLPCLISANEIEFAKTMFDTEYGEYLTDTEGLKLSDLRKHSGLQLPTIRNFEISFGLFFLSTKRYFTNLFNVCEWCCDLAEGKGAHLDRLVSRIEANKKLSKKIARLVDLNALKRHEENVKLANDIRNAYEHPTASNYVELKNVTFVPPANLSEPAFRIIKNEKIENAAWYQYNANLSRVYDEICSLTRDTLIVAGAAKSENMFPWNVIPISEDEIDPEMQIDCRIEIIHPSLWKKMANAED